MAPRPTKRRKLAPPLEMRPNSSDIQKPSLKIASSWDLEANYAAKRKNISKESSKLPIKTADGRLQQATTNLEDEADVSQSDDGWIDGAQAKHILTNPEDDSVVSLLPKPEQQQIKEAKEELAKIAIAINEEPEEHASAFKALANIAQSPIVSVQKLALITQMAVYRDVIPGYRIRPAEENVQVKLSKDVHKLRSYEQSLVKGYQAYIKDLTRCAKLDPATSQGLPGVAITCACTLATSVPHFNFRGDLLRILIGKLSKPKSDDDFAKCRRALQTIFSEDEDGNASIEAVSLLSKMIKARNFKVDESVVALFLHLRLLSEYSLDSHHDAEGNANGAQKRKKKQRQFRTKRERKQLKEQKALEKDMVLADAQVNHEERERLQAETLKQVFSNYIRILKLRLPRLMGVVLEGLARYAHLINMEFFGDLLEAMKDLIKHAQADEATAVSDVEGSGDDSDDGVDPVARNTSREALLCSITAFALLEGQDAAKSRHDPQLDLPFFQKHLYQTLFPLAVSPDLEINSKSLRLPGPDAAGPAASWEKKVNLETTTVLLLRCLTAVLLPHFNMRAVPAARLAAFTKRLLTASLQMPEKSCRALLVLLCDVVKLHGRKVAAMWNTEERLGDGTFRALASTPEASNPFAATIWEGELLRKHFCPEVREGVKFLEKAIDSTSRGG